jgi:hypothetical protein
VVENLSWNNSFETTKAQRTRRPDKRFREVAKTGKLLQTGGWLG